MKIRKSSFHPEIMTDFITVIDNVKQKSIHLKRRDSAVLRKTVLQFFRGELYCQKRRCNHNENIPDSYSNSSPVKTFSSIFCNSDAV